MVVGMAGLVRCTAEGETIYFGSRRGKIVPQLNGITRATWGHVVLLLPPYSHQSTPCQCEAQTLRCPFESNLYLPFLRVFFTFHSASSGS